MLPAKRLSIVTSETCTAGQVVRPIYNTIEQPRLVFNYRDVLHMLLISDEGQFPYTASLANAFTGPLLHYDNPRLEVDETTAYTGFSGSPRRGDAYISAAGPGFVGNMGHSEAFITLAGQMVIGNPDYARDFIGFRAWRLLVDLPGDGRTQTLAERIAPPPGD